MLRPPGKRWHWSCLWALLSAIVAVLAVRLPFVHTIELKTLDVRFRTFPSPQAARQDIVDFATDVIFKGYNRSQEIEADKLGAEYAYRVGYNPGGLVGFLEASLARSQKNEEAVSTGLMRTHPIHAERISGLRSYIQANLAGVDKLPRLGERYTQWTRGRI